MSIVERSSTPLSASATFFTSVVDINPEKQLVIVIHTDQTGTAYIEQSADGATSWSTIASIVVVPNFEIKTWVNPTKPYGRIRFVNDSTAQGFLKLFAALTAEALMGQ